MFWCKYIKPNFQTFLIEFEGGKSFTYSLFRAKNDPRTYEGIIVKPGRSGVFCGLKMEVIKRCFHFSIYYFSAKYKVEPRGQWPELHQATAAVLLASNHPILYRSGGSQLIPPCDPVWQKPL